MPNWKQIVVGDAFRLPSRNPRYYLDLVLIVPLFFAGLFLLDSIHTWHIGAWDLKQAGISGGLVCAFLLLIKDHIRVVAEILYTIVFLTWFHFSLHGDFESLKFSLLFCLALLLTFPIGIAFRVFVLKSPVLDVKYHNPDTQNTPLGMVLVLGLLLGLGTVGICLAYR